jgi:hypothetical protein
MRRLVLRIDALFLTVAGVFGLVSDLQSYASARGPFGQTFYQSPTSSALSRRTGSPFSPQASVVFGDTSHETFRTLGCAYRPCRYGRE